MAHPRKFRFGIQLSTAPSGQEWAASARKAEDLGYSTLFMPDHFGDQLAPVPALMAAADATTDLRIGALVFDNDYKHPVVLAKEIATLDVLSGGRVEFGIGAGWMTTDYEQSGIPKERDGVRIDRMVEALEVFRRAWAEGSFNFKGEHYTITDYDALPKPLQQPHPPILIGGGGPKVLRIAAQQADIVGINPRLTAGEVTAEAGQDARAEMVDTKVQWVKDAAGDRFDDLELNVLVFFSTVTDDARGMADGLAGAFSVTPDEVLEVPYAWFGTVDRDLRQAPSGERALGHLVLRAAGRRHGGHGARRRRARRHVSARRWLKLDAVELLVVRLPLVRPFVTAHGATAERDVLLVHVSGEDGEGWGECGADTTPTYWWETVSSARRGSALDRARRTRRRSSDGACGVRDGSARRRAPREDTSLAAHLGAARDRVIATATAGFDDDVESFVAAGYRSVKVKV